MRNFTLITVVLFITSNVVAQNVFPLPAGDVGIGTSAPSGLLHLKTLSGGHYWGAHNFGVNLVIDGPHHNSIGFFDANSANPFAITNIMGKLTISKMPALGDVTTAPA